jgi:hypothetical protein
MQEMDDKTKQWRPRVPPRLQPPPSWSKGFPKQTRSIVHVRLTIMRLVMRWLVYQRKDDGKTSGGSPTLFIIDLLHMRRSPEQYSLCYANYGQIDRPEKFTRPAEINRFVTQQNLSSADPSVWSRACDAKPKLTDVWAKLATELDYLTDPRALKMCPLF